ncbi:MAG TPA: TRAM domain-containing protein [Vicinamibacterales bacterium]|nr:TRAM domain-containing protein [Vicinamibacterales bacterium]
MTPGERLTLEIERPVAGGRMLARHEGAVVLVSGALPGEVVDARVERVQRGTVWAAVVAVLEASPDRVGTPNSCGGLVLAHARYERQLALKAQIIEDAFRRIGRLPLDIPVPVSASPVEGYRMRARLHVSGGRIGFYHEGTHDICDASSTGQLLPATCGVLAAAAEVLAGVPGVVEAVDVSENREASQRVLHLELARDADPSGLGRLAAVPGLSGMSLSHPGSPRVRVVSGEGRVDDRFARGAAAWTLTRGPQAFFQGNRFLLDGVVDAVMDALHGGAVLDLYAGVGLFSVAAAALGHAPVVAVEGDVPSTRDLRRNVSDWREQLEARHESVEDYLARGRFLRAPTVVVDPPRTGLSRRALDGVKAASAPRVVYVSCDVATLARDTRALVDAGYRLSGVQAFDLFPNTAHVETVAVLDR